MFVLGNLVIALVVVACHAGVIHDPPVLEYGVKAAPEVAYKPVIGYQEGPGYVVPKALPVGYGLPGPVPVGGVVKEVGALPYGAAVGGGLKPFGSYRTLFANKFPLYGNHEVIAPGLAYGVAPVAAPVKEVKEYISPVALKEYAAPVALKEYAPKVVLKEYTAPVALKGYGGPVVGYPVAQEGYVAPGYGYNVAAVGYGAPGVVGNGYAPVLQVKGYPAPVVVPKQEGYGLVKKAEW